MEKLVAHKWRNGRWKTDPDVAAEELIRIRAKHGELTAKGTVDEARDEKSPLHPEFEWDDGVAGEKYRINQASSLIRSIVVVEDKDRPEFIAWCRVDGKIGGEYLPSEIVVQKPDLFAGAIRRLTSEIAGAQHSLNDLQNLASANGGGNKLREIARVGKALKTARERAEKLI